VGGPPPSAPGVYGVWAGETCLYVGESLDIARRWKEHARRLRSYQHPTCLLQWAYRNGPLDWRVIELGPVGTAERRERELQWRLELRPWAETAYRAFDADDCECRPDRSPRAYLIWRRPIEFVHCPRCGSRVPWTLTIEPEPDFRIVQPICPGCGRQAASWRT
jgi:hypothetical protein